MIKLRLASFASSRLVRRRSPARVLIPVLGLVLVLSQGCRPAAPNLGPSGRLQSAEGYASLRFNGPNAAGRSKVSFSLELPDRARIDVFDALGRPIITLISGGTESYFAVISEKAYWRGSPGEVLGKFLGFEFSLEDLAELLAGRWGRDGKAGDAASSPWTLTRDSSGRVITAARQGVSFEVHDFFAGTAVPHTLTFESDRSSGSLKVFEVRFNLSPKESAFRPWFLKDYSSKTWPEMEDLLNHEAEVVR